MRMVELVNRIKKDLEELKKYLPNISEEVENIIEELEEKLYNHLFLPIDDINEILNLKDYKVEVLDEECIGIVMYPKGYITWDQLKKLEEILESKYDLEIKAIYIDVWTDKHEPPFSEAYLEIYIKYGYP